MSNQKRPQYRQGHILLDRVSRIPRAADRVVPAVPDHVVIAHGETGREHVFTGGRVTLFMEKSDQEGTNLFIEITGDGPVWLEHPEHGDIEVDPGVYKVIDQREADDVGFGIQERRSFD
jgi:hypothetical protein